MTNQPIHVLSTKALPVELIEQAAAQGIVLDTLPFISIIPLTDDDLDLGRNIRDLAIKPLVAVFTSMNAVDAVTGWLKTPPQSWRIFCIGSATRQVVEQIFWQKQVIAGMADSALRRWPNASAGGRVWAGRRQVGRCIFSAATIAGKSCLLYCASKGSR